MNAYIISVSSSIVASFVWWFLTSITGNSKKVATIFNNAYDSAKSFENAIEYNDYNTAVLQCDRTIDLLYKAYDNIRPLTFFKFQKKRLIVTYINNNLRILSIFKNRSIGYDEGQKENTARIEAIKKNLFNFVGNTPNPHSSLIISTWLLYSLAHQKGIKKSFKSDIFNSDKNVFINLIEINSFKTENNNKFLMQEEGLTKEEYNKLINDYLTPIDYAKKGIV